MNQSQNQYQELMTATDKARLQFSDQIKQNPSAFGQFARDNANALRDQKMAEKENSFLQARTDLARAMDQTHNVKLYQTRTADTDNLAAQLERNNQSVQGQLEDDKAMTKRQFEINQWYNYRKESTIGLLQNSAIWLGVIAIGYVGLRMAGSTGILPPRTGSPGYKPHWNRCVLPGRDDVVAVLDDDVGQVSGRQGRDSLASQTIWDGKH